MLTKKLHLRCFTRSWICLCRSSHLRVVLKNSYSEICSQNPWKIPMKKFIFSKVAGWQSATFSRIPWGFYLIKTIVKIVFCRFLSWVKTSGNVIVQLYQKRSSSKIFFKYFDWKFPLAVYQNIFLSRTSLWLLLNFV